MSEKNFFLQTQSRAIGEAECGKDRKTGQYALAERLRTFPSICEALTAKVDDLGYESEVPLVLVPIPPID